jgi:hypothetical protein
MGDDEPQVPEECTSYTSYQQKTGPRIMYECYDIINKVDDPCLKKSLDVA